jgi:hypothetical protein
MGLRVPQSQIVTSKYTSGKEYMFNQTYREYIGYYYELNSKLFAGKEFNTNAPELIRIDSNKVNKLLTNPSTYVYGKISGVKIPNTKITSISSQITGDTPEEIIEYYVKKINSYIIKQVDEKTYINTKKDPLYLTLQIKAYPLTDEVYVPKDLEQAEKEFPGIKAFLDL